MPSIKFETDSGSARQLDEPFENENINLEGYQIDDSRAWDSTYVQLCTFVCYCGRHQIIRALQTLETINELMKLATANM